MDILKKIFKSIEINSTKLYLVLANVVLVVFAIWFSNVNLLPFRSMGDFLFFAALALILALYRPGWTFAFFVGTLALENINLVPDSFGVALRPYQFFGLITIVSLFVRFFSKRLNFNFPKFGKCDWLVVAFAACGFLSSVTALNKGMSLKQSIVAFSFVALYFLVRIYVQTLGDAKRIFPFFLSSAFVVTVYGIWQNVRFLNGVNPFEVMPGRPNATFTEADWFGIYLVFLLGILYAILYFFKKGESGKISLIFNQYFNFQIFKKILVHLFILVVYVALILTVSRSAWVGAVFVTLAYIKFILLIEVVESDDKNVGRWQRFFSVLKMENWNWRKAGFQVLLVAVILTASLLVSIFVPLTRFQLGNRAISTNGVQKITIACPGESINDVPTRVQRFSDIGEHGCWQINLEEIDDYRNAGVAVAEVYRPDPNVSIRSEIYRESWKQIKSNPILGLGWGGISSILGRDERGAGLNASNIFFEIWLGSGLLGFLSFVILIGYIVISSIGMFLKSSIGNEGGVTVAFIVFGWIAIIVPNLFNSGIFLGFVWTYFAIAVSLLASEK